MLKVEIHPEAQAELDAAIVWYEQERKGLGLDLLEEVDRAIGKAMRQPDVWRSYATLANLHRLNVRRFPYCVIYRRQHAMVTVVAVAHQRRKPGYWRSRLGNSDNQ